MAEVITRLRLDSGEYDNKIKRATQGLLQMEKECRKVGGTLAILEKDQKNYVASLGQMETVANNSKGQLRELTNAYNDLALQFERLTDEEKKGDFGRALSGSMDQLMQRAGVLRDRIDDTNEAIKNMASDTQFADGLNLMSNTVGNLATVFVGLAGNSKEATEVLRDMATIQATINAVESLTKAFQRQNLVLLKNPYVLAAAAIAALGLAIYECTKHVDGGTKQLDDYKAALNEVATAANLAKYSVEDLFMVAEQNARAKAAADEATPLLQENATLMSEIQQLKKNGGTRNRVVMTPGGQTTLVTEQVNVLDEIAKKQAQIAKNNEKIAKLRGEAAGALAMTDYIDKSYDMQTASTSTKGESSGGAGSFTAERIKEVKTEVTSVMTEYDRLNDELKLVESSMEHYAKTSDDWKTMNDYAEQLRKTIAALNGETQEMAQGFSGPTSQAFGAYTEMLSQMQGALEMGSSSWLNMQAQKIDVTTLQNLLTAAINNGLDTAIIDSSGLWEKILSGEGVTDEAWQNLEKEINAKLKELNLNPIKLNVKTGDVTQEAKEVDEEWKHAAQSIQQAGGAIAGIENPAAKVAGTLAQAIATVALGYAKATDKAASTGPWGWIAFAATGLATLVSTISVIKSATAGSYASGGIIPGSSYSGDRQIAHVNAGELILNKAQQGNLASQLSQDGGAQSSTPYVSGEQIFLGLNNYLKRSGRGELITTR